MMDMSQVDERGLEDLLSEPVPGTRETLAQIPGDVAILGAGGKMGPTLALMAKKAAPERVVYAVSRFTDRKMADRLADRGIEIVEADLLDESAYARLPEVPNVLYLAGRKFGATGNQPLTWAMNAYVPALVARQYNRSRIVALSTGNVYPFVDPRTGGAKEDDDPGPVGEYAQSCLARERVFQYFSGCFGTAVTLIRLNYANEPRYGILVDLTFKILHDEPIDLTMGAVNLIWQGDANNYILRALSVATSPPAILNVTGIETLKVRDIAQRIAGVLGKTPQFTSREAPTSLLSNASKCVERFGKPAVSLDEMIVAVVTWVTAGKPVLNKPTKYNVRDGRF
ncbi:MAG TPA: NAD-dependent epimerase/dehydratase family protein [Sedimentisphaerales bacterium]|jgi:nucleoside-diphosphate-sugar epimerase|nr:NAD-dependent epimerase/dehydratase family protein [Sedimentisphaerales bacterium]HNU28765.1 NAD-dependent epimerase/dehydratase family protein [Sedimentisphaerales bacterium]